MRKNCRTSRLVKTQLSLEGPRALVLGLLLLILPSVGLASDVVPVTWDNLAPFTQDAGAEPQSAEAPHSLDPSGTTGSTLPLANSFDPLNDGRLVVEQWDPEDHAVTNDLVDLTVALNGYVLPLVWEQDKVVEFLLVPWVGACIHTPAPPPNQIVHVDYPEGLELEKEFEAFQLAGTLRHAPANHDLFLVDGRRHVPASYALTDIQVTGAAGDIVASSRKDLPMIARVQIWAESLFIESMTAVGTERSRTAFLSALLLAFAYGVFHTFGPGHGKSVVVSYFVGTGGNIWRGLNMGARIAIVHVLSAMVAVFAFDFAVRQTTGSAPSDYQAIRVASYGLIMIIGASMLWHAVSGFLSERRGHAVAPRAGDACAHHGQAQGVAHHKGCAACAAATSTKGSGWIAASVGLVPCTGALLVMLYGLANDLVMPAVFMVLAISAGMAIAMSAIGVLAILGRNLAERRLVQNEPRRRSFEIGARLVGSTCVLAIGTLLFVSALSNPGSSQILVEKSVLGPPPILGSEG